ncbi:NADH dehydrogenase [ubiquinone] 1 beta subcomplex subunit 10 [Neodiprion pinetum]|uniref:NADH dehydrogenase [ubiquinone] 1 beta subcomplex subunit 10 n=1 Tax=Neodiprion lecontei TaxID=441921 RepID=A0A6J0BQB4_NEOLC|nr:NADH dehydrogenase [ubiquinone] 1 beta subcomplex subunit 10 [Neodiprion lecontei]XP_046420435.1 NADH dehydrogenase [ubiquinone] 1 beta subcomplex subunit 10 [Neodiprion fabricii]XP_046476812.1 NADH dehydrogenase [ubiquinone] 1 beta subcomplex subunit 10 [Neodiprion pinetum]
MAEERNIVIAFANAVFNILDGPVTFFREKIVVPNQQHYPWYHQKFRRVPTIDECYMDDPVCSYEANIQFKRDKLVESDIINILRQRFEDCTLYEGHDQTAKCRHLWDQYNEASTNWFIKYGDLGAYGHTRDALMKQKHRMIWERRYGPVGTGMNRE